MTIERVERTVVTQDPAVAPGPETAGTDPQVSRPGPVKALARSLVIVALAALAILVLLPAAVAAQAASG